MQTKVRRNLLESLPVALVGADSQGLIKEANSAALRMFGYQRDELVGQPIDILVPQRFAGSHASYHRNYVKAPEARPMGKGRDLSAVRADGSEFPVEIGLTFLPLEDGEQLFLASVVDISIRKAAEKTLLERQRELETFLEEKTQQLEAEIAEKSRLEERQRLGRDLHDSISQSLYGIGLGIRTAIAKNDREQDPKPALDYVLSLTEAALVEMRALLFKLRPKSLENVPLCDILRSHLTAVGLRNDLKTELRCVDEPPEDMKFEVKNAIYRIATEALHNCVKHAEADSIVLTLRRRDSGFEVEIKDDGKGFDPERGGGGHGLQTMRERAEGHQGSLQIESSTSGSAVTAWMPVS